MPSPLDAPAPAARLTLVFTPDGGCDVCWQGWDDTWPTAGAGPLPGPRAAAANPAGAAAPATPARAADAPAHPRRTRARWTRAFWSLAALTTCALAADGEPGAGTRAGAMRLSALSPRVGQWPGPRPHDLQMALELEDGANAADAGARTASNFRSGEAVRR